MAYFITKKGNGEELDLRDLDGLSRASGEYSVEKQPELKKGLGKLYQLPSEPYPPMQPREPQLPDEAKGDQQWNAQAYRWERVKGTEWSDVEKAEWLAKATEKYEAAKVKYADDFAKYEIAKAKWRTLFEKRRKLLARLLGKLQIPAGNRRFNYGWGAPDSPARALAPRLRLLTPEDQREFASIDRRITALQIKRTALITEAWFRGQKPTPEELGAYVDKLAKQRARQNKQASRSHSPWSRDTELDARFVVKFDKARDDAIKAEAEAKAKAEKAAEKLAAEKAKKHAAALARRRDLRAIDKALGVVPKRRAA